MTKPWNMSRVRSKQAPRKHVVPAPVGDRTAVDAQPMLVRERACECCGFHVCAKHPGHEMRAVSVDREQVSRAVSDLLTPVSLTLAAKQAATAAILKQLGERFTGQKLVTPYVTVAQVDQMEREWALDEADDRIADMAEQDRGQQYGVMRCRDCGTSDHVLEELRDYAGAGVYECADVAGCLKRQETLGKGEPQQPLQSCVPITYTRGGTAGGSRSSGGES